MAYNIPGASFPGGMPGEPAHTVRTGAVRATPHFVQGHVRVRITRPKTQAAPRRPKAAAPPAQPIDPNAGLVGAATRLRYGPQEQAIQAQLVSNTNYRSGIPQWYQNALTEINALKGQGQASSQQTLAQLQNYNSPATLPGNATDAQAATARNSLNSQYATMFGRDEQANAAFMDRLAAANAVGQANAQIGAQRERQGILGNEAALKAAEGDYGVTQRAALQAAQQKALADQAKLELAAQALGIKTETLRNVQEPLAQSLKQNRTAGQRTSRGRLRETQRQNRVQNAIDVSKQSEKALVDANKIANQGKPKAPKAPSRAQSNTAQTSYDRAQALIRHVYGQNKALDVNTVADQLATSKHAVPHDLALAAAQFVKNQRQGIAGIDDPRLAKAIQRRYGIRIPVVHQSPAIGHVVQGLIKAVVPGA